MYRDAGAQKALEDVVNVIRAEVIKLRVLVAKRTAFGDKCAIVLNNYQVIRRRIPDLIESVSAISAGVTFMRKEDSDHARDCLDARDAGVDLGVWSPVNMPEESQKGTPAGPSK